MGEAAQGRCFTIFYGIYCPGDKIADFSPSYSWVHFGEPLRRPTQKKRPGASTTARRMPFWDRFGMDPYIYLVSVGIQTPPSCGKIGGT